MCGAVALFACLDTTAKYLNTQMDSLQIAWARYYERLRAGAVRIQSAHAPGLLMTRRPLLQITRSRCWLRSTALNFFALRWLQLDEALSIIFTFPFIVAIIVGPDARRVVRLAAMVGDRSWVYRCSSDHASGLRRNAPAALISLGATICYALYAVITRIVSRGRFQSDVAVLREFHRRARDAAGHSVRLEPPADWVIALMLTMTGVLGSTGHYFLIAGHKLAPASVLAPYMYTQLIWVIILGYLVFGQVPTQLDHRGRHHCDRLRALPAQPRAQAGQRWPAKPPSKGRGNRRVAAPSV